MITPLFSESDILADFDQLEKDTEENIIQIFRYAGEKFIEFARLDGAYSDDTGNLRASIGYAIINKGRVLKFGVSRSNTEGKIEAAKLVDKELSRVQDDNLYLIGFAGMEYAAAVEGIHNLDVITGSSIKIEKILKESLKEAFKNG